MGPLCADDFDIQPLTAAHRSGWQPLWEAYLRFYRGEVAEAVTDATFARLCDPDGDMAGLVAVSPDGGVAGIANLVFHPTTWDVTSMCYLEDLFVSHEARGAGVAKRLLDAVYETAAGRGAGRVYWHTQQFNAPARSLYDTLARLQSWVVYEHEL